LNDSIVCPIFPVNGSTGAIGTAVVKLRVATTDLPREMPEDADVTKKAFLNASSFRTWLLASILVGLTDWIPRSPLRCISKTFHQFN
jgi:hypothetical protein